MVDRLSKYRKMRDFGVTPEPAGGAPRPGTLPIFVIQKHHASHLHYDFRLEMEGVLKSWAVPKGPSYDPDTKRLAMMTEDHPYDYAKFEGVIPAGNYGGGNVIIWDEGAWEFIEPGDDPVKALAGGKLTFRMFGKKMFGEWALVKIHGRSTKGNEWLLLKHRDEFAAPNFDITTVAPLSVVSNRDVEDVSPERVWQSNRGASLSGSKAPTIASALEHEQEVKKATTRKRAAASSAPVKKAAATKNSAVAAPKKAARKPAGTSEPEPAKSASAPTKRAANKVTPKRQAGASAVKRAGTSSSKRGAGAASTKRGSR
jgi:bifunctional non-homologous end joining protein LigD